MKWFLAWVVCALFLLSLVPLAFAEGTLTGTSTPSLSINTPQDETVVAGKVVLEFDVENFELTPRPNNEPNQGVIAIYVDGKFYTNTATGSATVQLSRIGTHRIDAELVYTSRRLVLPRASDSIYVHNQRKLPFLFVSNIRNGTTVYSPQPTLQITSRIEQYEDQNAYYQVFVNGVLDGDSTQSPDKQAYSLKQSLKEGRNSIRVALYGENGKPYSPVVDTVVEVFYQTEAPALKSVEIEPDLADNSAHFNVELNDFKVPENGFILARAGDKEISFSTTSGTLRNLPPGPNTITFNLVDMYGFEIIPKVSAESAVTLGSVSEVEVNPVMQPGVFIIAESGATSRTGLVGLAFIQGFIILLIGTILAFRHSYHYH